MVRDMVYAVVADMSERMLRDTVPAIMSECRAPRSRYDAGRDCGDV